MNQGTEYSITERSISPQGDTIYAAQSYDFFFKAYPIEIDYFDKSQSCFYLKFIFGNKSLQKFILPEKVLIPEIGVSIPFTNLTN